MPQKTASVTFPPENLAPTVIPISEPTKQTGSVSISRAFPEHCPPAAPPRSGRVSVSEPTGMAVGSVSERGGTSALATRTPRARRAADRWGQEDSA